MCRPSDELPYDLINDNEEDAVDFATRRCGCRPGVSEPPLRRKVVLQVYAIGKGMNPFQRLNSLLHPLGKGFWHVGVEVYGREWTFSQTWTMEGDGVDWNLPGLCPEHDHYMAVDMGNTQYNEEQVLHLIEYMKEEWTMDKYNTALCNCIHFSDELCRRLGVGAIPDWVMGLAAVPRACQGACCVNRDEFLEEHEVIIDERSASTVLDTTLSDQCVDTTTSLRISAHSTTCSSIGDWPRERSA